MTTTATIEFIIYRAPAPIEHTGGPCVCDTCWAAYRAWCGEHVHGPDDADRDLVQARRVA